MLMSIRLSVPNLSRAVNLHLSRSESTVVVVCPGCQEPGFKYNSCKDAYTGQPPNLGFGQEDPLLPRLKLQTLWTRGTLMRKMTFWGSAKKICSCYFHAG